jgi:hypothetical protein
MANNKSRWRRRTRRTQHDLLESLSIWAIDLVVSVLPAHSWMEGSWITQGAGPTATERPGSIHPSALINGDWCSLSDRSCRPPICVDDSIIFLFCPSRHPSGLHVASPKKRESLSICGKSRGARRSDAGEGRARGLPWDSSDFGDLRKREIYEMCVKRAEKKRVLSTD